MDVAQITMDKTEAQQRYDDYREALIGREPTDEDRGVMLGYKALAKGKGLLDLHAVFRACPANPKGQPAFAIARAHWRRIVVQIETGGGSVFDQASPEQSFWRRAAWHRRILFPRGTMPENLRPKVATTRLAAIVPMIPANLRPTRALNRYVILWEAEWEKLPPTDPLLLRHLHGSLYVVLAAWDLTPLEKAVITGRLTER